MLETIRGLVRPTVVWIVLGGTLIFEAYRVLFQQQPISEQWWALAQIIPAFVVGARTAQKKAD